jgi:hypothetical protein
MEGVPTMDFDELPELNLTARDLGLRTTGRASKKVTAVVAGTLTQSDLDSLADERGTVAQPIKKLRAKHHALARAIASGVGDGDAAVLIGYTASRVSILKSDPSFKELVRFYTAKVDDQYLGMHERMAGLGLDAVNELSDRLEDEPEAFSNTQLLEMASRMGDRTGHGVSTSTNVNVKVGLANRLEQARARMTEAAAGDGAKLISGEVLA